MNNFSNVAVLLPALNEEAAIVSTIKHVKAALPNSQIVVIDNGSKDRTAILATEAGAEVYLENRKGKGSAFRRGLTEIRKEIEFVVMIDADDTYELRKAPEAISHIVKDRVGMIIGNRQPISLQNRKAAYRSGHRSGNVLLTRLYQLLFNIRIEDTLSGWRVMSRPFIDTFPSKENGFSLEAELNAHAYVLNCDVRNIDVEYRGRTIDSVSKLSTLKDGAKILRATLRMFNHERPRLAFNLLSAPWLLSGGALVFRSLREYVQTGMVLHFPSLILGVGLLVISSLLWVCGMILERTKMLKQVLIQFEYRQLQKELL